MGYYITTLGLLRAYLNLMLGFVMSITTLDETGIIIAKFTAFVESVWVFLLGCYSMT